MWPYWIVVTLGVLAFAVWRRSGIAAPALVLAGLLLAQATAVLPHEMRLLALTWIWVAIGGVMVRQLDAPLPGALFLASGLCYPAAWLSGAPLAIGQPWFVASDVLGLAGLVAIVWGACSGVAGGKVRAMGRSGGRRLAWYRTGNLGLSEEAGKER